jgi:hypothetical protein
MRLVALTALALCTCKPAPPPEPTPAEPIATPPPVARAEPPAEPPAEPERCKCPGDAPAEPPTDDDEVDEFADKRRARAKRKVPKALATRLSAALPEHRAACDVALSGPCALRGDLDGDGALDDVVLVRARDGAGGLAILWATGTTELLGGGRRGQCWTTTEVADLDGTSDVEPCPQEIDADLSWIAHWELRPRQVKDGPVLTDPGRRREWKAPGAVGDGLMLSGTDAAAALYRTAAGWTLMHLGF